MNQALSKEILEAAGWIIIADHKPHGILPG